jgi:membrane fusion protein, multidrug efflux system
MTASSFRRNAASVLLCTAIFTAGALCSCSNTKTKDTASKKKNTAVSYVEGFCVQPMSLEQMITVSGTLKPFEETTLMPEVSGRVVALNIPEGKFVRKGTVLVKLFDGDLQAQLIKLNTQLDIAQQTEKRQAELIKISGISQLDYDQAVLNVHSITADIAILKVQIEKTAIKAPFDGVVGLRNLSLGTQVTSSTALTTIRSTQAPKLDFSVPEKYAQGIRANGNVSFTVQGDSTHYSAKVIASEEGIDAATRNLRVRALVASNGRHLMPGAFANITLSMGKNTAALMIPAQALIPRERDKQVILVRGNKAEFVTVTTGIRQESLVEVTGGLSIDDTIATTGILFIRPGMKVTFSKVSRHS